MITTEKFTRSINKRPVIRYHVLSLNFCNNDIESWLKINNVSKGRHLSIDETEKEVNTGEVMIINVYNRPGKAPSTGSVVIVNCY